jgi:tetratricopeptide (TPR) repeat protein
LGTHHQAHGEERELKPRIDLFIDAYEEALDTLSAQAAEHPDHADAQHRLGLLFYLAGDPEHAIERHERALALNPRYTAAASALGYALERVRGPAAAFAHWQSAQDRDPEPRHPHEHAGVALDLAMVYGRRGDSAAGLRMLEQMAPMGRHRHLVDRERLFLYVLAGRPNEALAIHARLAALDPLLEKLLVAAGIDAQALADTSAIERYLMTREANHNLSGIHLYLGLTYAAFAAREKAEAAFAAALAADFDLATYHVQMGRLAALEGDEEEAAGEFARALAIDPEHVRARIDLGYELAGLGRIEEAIAEFEMAIRHAPSYPDLHHQLALLYAESERPDEAEASLHRALALNPRFPLARASLALLYARSGRHEEALAEYERVLATGLCSADIYLSIGLLHLRCGRTEQAIEALRRGARFNPRYAPIHYHLGRIFQERGQRARAYASWRRFFHYAEETNLGDRLDLFRIEPTRTQTDAPGRADGSRSWVEPDGEADRAA